MGTFENKIIAENEASIVKKRALASKKERIKKGEAEGEPAREDYETADKTLTQEIADFIKEGAEEYEEIFNRLKNRYDETMDKTANLEKEPKRLLILECTGMNNLLGQMTFLSDERINASNFDVIDVTEKADDLPKSFDEVSGIVITGSPADIEEKGEKLWIRKMEGFVEKALKENVPVFGVCFGIQAHADIKGREVPKNEGGREMGVWKTDIFLTEEEAKHPIFKGIKFKEEKNGERMIKRASLETLGSHAFHARYDPKFQSKITHGFRFTKEGYYYPMIETDGSFIGVQFHPEFSIPEGIEILKALVKKRADKLVADGKDPKKILEDLKKYKDSLKKGEVPDNIKFFNNFIDIITEEK